ncbi:MAG: hypothetical protein RL257_282 [Actinomycetota bacterium]
MKVSKSTSAWVMLLAGISGLIASFILTIDKFKILKDAGYTPSCNINATLNCKSVMLSKQAEVFGFPNSIIGIGAFSIMLTIAVLLFFGFNFPKLFLQLATFGTALAVIFCHWLAYQTTFVIGALCPYCMVAWVATLLVAWVATLLVLSVLLRELVELKKQSIDDEDGIVAIDTIKKWLVPFHALWATLLVGAAFLGV